MALRSAGNWFQTRGPATQKARSPSLSLVDCLTRSLLLAEWFEAWPGTVVVSRFVRKQVPVIIGLIYEILRHWSTCAENSELNIVLRCLVRIFCTRWLVQTENSSLQRIFIDTSLGPKWSASFLNFSSYSPRTQQRPEPLSAADISCDIFTDLSYLAVWGTWIMKARKLQLKSYFRSLLKTSISSTVAVRRLYRAMQIFTLLTYELTFPIPCVRAA